MILQEKEDGGISIRAVYDMNIVAEEEFVSPGDYTHAQIMSGIEDIIIRNVIVLDMIDLILMGALNIGMGYDALKHSEYDQDLIARHIVCEYNNICSLTLMTGSVCLLAVKLTDNSVETADKIEVVMNNIIHRVTSIVITDEVWKKMEDEFGIFREAVEVAYRKWHTGQDARNTPVIERIYNMFANKTLGNFILVYHKGDNLLTGVGR